MSNGGFFLVHRRLFDDWKWQCPYRSAWLWIMAKANYGEHEGLQRGQCRFSVSWAPKEWGMTESSARRFLARCENEKNQDGEPSPSLYWERGKGGRGGGVSGGVGDDVSGGVSGGVVGVITVLNYDKYQDLCDCLGGVSGGVSGGVGDDVSGGPILIEKKEDKIKVKKNKNITPRTKAQVAKTLEEVDQEIGSIVIADFFREYEPQGLDVAECFNNWREWCRGENPSKPQVNPGKYCIGYFNKAFHNACKGALKRGYHLLSARDPRKQGEDPNDLARRIRENREQALREDV